MKKYLLILTLLTSCKTIYIPVESVRTEYKDKYVRDSIHTIDSILQYVKGDTVHLDRIKYIYKDKVRVDSIFIQDTISVVVEVERIKEVNRLTQWQIVQMWIGRGLLILAILFIGIKYLRRRTWI